MYHVATPDPDWQGDAPKPASSKAPWRVYNIGAQTDAFIEFHRNARKRHCKTADKQMLPMQPGDVQDTFADVEALVNAVDYRPAVGVEEGVARFIQWYRNYPSDKS